MKRASLKLKAFHTFMHELATLSTCKRTAVGCIILPQDFTAVFAIGYNGQAAGISNSACTNKKGDCGCVHAEANAIIKMREPPHHFSRGHLLLSTVAPCYRCASLIINSQWISDVIYDKPYRNERGVHLLHDALVGVYQYDDYL